MGIVLAFTDVVWFPLEWAAFLLTVNRRRAGIAATLARILGLHEPCCRTETLLALILISFGLGIWAIPSAGIRPIQRVGIPLPAWTFIMCLVGGVHLVGLLMDDRAWRIIGSSAMCGVYLFLNLVFHFTGVPALAGTIFGVLLVFAGISWWSLRRANKPNTS